MNKKILGTHKVSGDRLKKIWSEAFTKKVVQEKLFFREYLILSLVTSIVSAVAVLILMAAKKIPPEIPLFYGSPEGEAQLAPQWMLILPSLVALIFLVINILVAYNIKEEFLKKTLSVGSVVITFLSLVTTYKIAALVGSF